MREEHAAMPEYEALVPLMSRHFAEVSAAANSGRLTNYGLIAEAIGKGTPLIAGELRNAIMTTVGDRQETRFNESLGWIERNVYTDPVKREQHERDKRRKTMLAGVVTEVTVQVGSFAIQRFLGRREAHKINRFIYRSMLLVAREGDRAVDDAQTTAIDMVLNQLGVEGKHRQALLAEPAPSSILELDPIVKPETSVRLGLFVPAAEIAMVKGFDERRRRLFAFGANKLALSQAEMNAVVASIGADNEERSTHLNALLRAYTHTMLHLSVDTAAIRRRALTLAQFDPLEATRRRNREIIKVGTLTTLGVAAATLPDPGQRLLAAAARDVCKEVLVSLDQRDSGAVDQAFVRSGALGSPGHA